jgi:hypothetical protein
MSGSDGKQLENFVAFVEETLKPSGFTVEVNRKLHDDNGRQIAEFDVEVRGKVGTGQICWLIECRDRPSEGAAPKSWIEQLYGRQAFHKFNKITAVSTMGFSAGAREAAQQFNIELRELTSADPKDFAWLAIEQLPITHRNYEITNVEMVFDEKFPGVATHELRGKTIPFDPQQPCLISKDNVAITPATVFLMLVDQNGGWEKCQANGPHQEYSFSSNVDPDDPLLYLDGENKIPLTAIKFRSNLRVKTYQVTPATYRYNATTGELISEFARFNTDMGASVELHRLVGEPELRLVVRASDQKNE